MQKNDSTTRIQETHERLERRVTHVDAVGVRHQDDAIGIQFVEGALRFVNRAIHVRQT